MCNLHFSIYALLVAHFFLTKSETPTLAWGGFLEWSPNTLGFALYQQMVRQWTAKPKQCTWLWLQRANLKTIVSIGNNRHAVNHVYDSILY
jgi:hypothetical protein